MKLCGVKKSDFTLDDKFFLNRTRREFIYLNERKKNSVDKNNWIIHSLQLLTAIGNDKGGGDFHKGKMQDEEICKEFIEKLLKIDIQKVIYSATEKTISLSNKVKGIRLDVFVETNDGRIIDIEMQTEKENQDFGKRTRYYQGLIDLNRLEKGESYRKLKESYIIFVCTFDPFKLDRKIYTFRNKCIEEENLELNGGATKIFLNATGTIGDIDSEIKNFWEYVKSGKVVGLFTGKVDNRLKELKNREEIGVEYITLELWLQDAKDEAFDEGISKGAFAEKLNNLKRLIKKMHMSIDEAMEFSDIPESERAKYKSKLENE